VTRYKEKSPSQQLSEVGPALGGGGTNTQSKQAHFLRYES